MRKRSAQWALFVAFAMILAACSGDTAPQETTGGTGGADTTAAPGSDTTTGGADTTTGGADTTTAGGLEGTTVTVLGPESSDAEAGALQEVLGAFAEANGMTINYTGSRDAEEQINAQVAAGSPPDIFVFPQPGKLADFARNGDILVLPEDVAATMSENWAEGWTAFGNVDDQQYGIPVKSDLKSLVWYQPQRFTDAGYEVPTTYDEFVALTDTMIADGNTPLCVGIESGPATGWPFTDWTEEMMLRLHGGDVYDQWVAGELPFASPEVSEAMTAVLDVWNKPDAVFAAGGSIAATPFGDNALPLLNGDCLMHRQANFFASFFTAEDVAASDGGEVDVFYFPDINGDTPTLVAGTLVGAFRDAPEVWEVMKFFSSPEYASERQKAQAALNGGEAGTILSGFMSAVNGQEEGIYNPLEQSFLDILSSAELVRFDGSDLMPAAVGAGAFWTEGTAIVNGDATVEEATANIDAAWPTS